MDKSQFRVSSFLKKYSLSHKPATHALDLVSEVGEIAKELLKGSRYGRQEISKSEALKSEMGDAYYSLLSLANSLDIDLEEALELVLQKYESRLKKGGAGSENE